MTDRLTPERRSRLMAAVRSKNTQPEIMLRRALRLTGATGYRLHVKGLPGKPDIVFSRWRVAVFVDGAFWHGYPGRFKPEKATPYWKAKIEGNRVRDRKADSALEAAGWTVIRIWDFEIKKDLDAALSRTLSALRDAGWRQSGSSE
jgi:DNA mismatch endonuclease, patch repair protein